VDLGKLKGEKAGFFAVKDPGSPNVRYLLTIVDHFSKYAWVCPQVKKSETIKNMRDFMGETKGKRIGIIQSDNGLEFKNGQMTKLLKDHSISQIFSLPYKPNSQGLVERFNGTIKNKIYRYLTQKKYQKENGSIFVEDLQSLVDNYNNTKQSTTKVKPIDAVRGKSTNAIKSRIEENAIDMMGGTLPNKKGIKKGSKVRISLEAFPELRKIKIGKKRYTPNYTEKVYTVESRRTRGQSTFYRVEGIDRPFSFNDLIKVDHKTVSNTEIRPRRKRKEKETIGPQK